MISLRAYLLETIFMKSRFVIALSFSLSKSASTSGLTCALVSSKSSAGRLASTPPWRPKASGSFADPFWALDLDSSRV
jgi:hypothetical protein